MKISLKQYIYVQQEIDAKEVEIPTEPVYYFETGIRRSIRIIPIYTTHQKEYLGKDEELHSFEITCVYNDHYLKIEKFTIPLKGLESFYYSKEPNDKITFVQSWLHKWFDTQTKERFDSDFEAALNKLR